jgi:hypothetical protein
MGLISDPESQNGHQERKMSKEISCLGELDILSGGVTASALV